jgi:hypothetical protein
VLLPAALRCALLCWMYATLLAQILKRLRQRESDDRTLQVEM